MTSATQPFELTATEASSLLDEGKLSPVELTESCLRRIDALDGALHAWALVDHDGAMESARRAEKEISQGNRRGPLHGVPVGVKDIFYTQGLRTEAGSRSWAGFVPTYDAASVTRLKDAGAVILGKTTTTEFAMLNPSIARNPWNSEHTPGGSSAGSGAGVAARMCPVALGSQTGGSVLRPAAYNGIVGLKPNHGRISAYGVAPVSWVLDHVGVLARSVEDTAMVLQTLAGYDGRDHYSLKEPFLDYIAILKGELEPPRIGLVRDYFFEKSNEELQRHTEAVAARLAEAGAQVRDVKLPSGFSDIFPTHRTIMYVEAAAYHEEMFAARRNDYGAKTRDALDWGLSVPGPVYARALQARLQHIADVEPVMRDVDVLLTPGIPATAPKDLSTTGDMAMQVPWSYLGWPSLGIPSGLGESGLPLAVQLLAGPRAEERVLMAGLWCERVLGVSLRPPLD